MNDLRAFYSNVALVELTEIPVSEMDKLLGKDDADPLLHGIPLYFDKNKRVYPMPEKGELRFDEEKNGRRSIETYSAESIRHSTQQRRADSAAVEQGLRRRAGDPGLAGEGVDTAGVGGGVHQDPQFSEQQLIGTMYKTADGNLIEMVPIARMCHEINRGYCLSMGDTSQPRWKDAPIWQKQSAIYGVAKLIENPKATPEEMHEAWMKQKIADGWIYGTFKDAENKTHPCLLPYNRLPRFQRAKDYIFKAVVNTICGDAE